MPDAYRSETEAALQRAEALRRENEDLKRRLARAERAAAADARIAALQSENAALRAKLGERVSPAPRSLPPPPLGSGVAGAVALGAFAVLMAGFAGIAAHRPAAVSMSYATPRPVIDLSRGLPQPTDLRAVPTASGPGVLGIRVEPAGVRGLQVTVDGAPVRILDSRGVTEPLDSGRAHLVRVRAEGYRPMSTSLWVRPGQADNFNVRLFPLDPPARR